MWSINIFLLLLHLVSEAQSVNSTQPTLARNYFITSGRKQVTITDSLPADFGKRFYTSTYPNTINPISRIYYATAEMNAATYGPYYPGSWTDNFIWYEISTENYSRTHLTTAFNGFIQQPFFSYFTYSYLLVLDNNPFIGNYVAIQELEFTPTQGVRFVNFPSSYQNGHSICYSAMIKQIRKIYVYMDMYTMGFEYYVGITVANETANNKFRFDIVLPSYVIVYMNYSVTYTVVVIDSTALNSNLPKFDLEASMLTSYGGSVIASSFGKNVFFSDYNIFLGIGQYFFYNSQEPSFKFSISYTNSSFDATFYGPTSYISYSNFYFSYSYAFFAYLDCKKPYFLYNQSQDTCYDDCMNSSLYYNQTTNTCQVCASNCETCYSYSSCKTCYNGTYRQLVNFKCLPIDGYYESNTNVSSQCDSTCATCIGSSANCTKCSNISQLLVNNSCRSCGTFFQGCSTCNQTACFSCNSSYFFISNTYCSLPCNQTLCRVCSNQNTSQCYQCRSGFLLQSGTCFISPVCGDMIINSTEQCDDGNNQNRDGCDSQCVVEQYYQCYSVATVFGYNYTHYCAYTHQIDLTIISIEKINYANRIKAIISIVQYEESFWSTKASLGSFIVESPIPYKDMRVQFISRSTSSVKFAQKLSTTLTSHYPQSSLLAIHFDYLQPIHNQVISLGFNFSQSLDFSLKQIPTNSITFTLVPENNHYADLYSAEVYSKQKQFSDFLTFLSISAIILMILTFIFGCKRITTEMLVVFQVSYASLLAVPKITPLFSSLTSLSYANNVYNVMYNTDLRPFEDTLVNSRLIGAVFYSQFLYNFNTGIVFILAPLLVGIIIIIISKVKNFDDDVTAKKVAKAGALAVGEYVFAGLVFGGCVIAVSAILEMQYGMREMATLGGQISLVIAAVLLVMYPVYGLVRVKRPMAFQEYNEVLLRNVNTAVAFQMVYFYLGLISGVIICMCPLSFVNCFVCILPLILFIATIKQRLFRKPMDKYRTQLNLLSIVFGQIPFIYANIQGGSNSSSIDDNVLMIPLAVGLVLFVNFMGNLIFLSYEIYKRIREKFYAGEILLQQPENINVFNISKITNRPMLDTFINYSEKELEELYLIRRQEYNETPVTISNILLSVLKNSMKDKLCSRQPSLSSKLERTYETEMGPI